MDDVVAMLLWKTGVVAVDGVTGTASVIGSDATIVGFGPAEEKIKQI